MYQLFSVVVGIAVLLSGCDDDKNGVCDPGVGDACVRLCSSGQRKLLGECRECSQFDFVVKDNECMQCAALSADLRTLVCQ